MSLFTRMPQVIAVRLSVKAKGAILMIAGIGSTLPTMAGPPRNAPPGLQEVQKDASPPASAAKPPASKTENRATEAEKPKQVPPKTGADSAGQKGEAGQDKNTPAAPPAEPSLQVVQAEDQANWELVKGSSQAIDVTVTTDEDAGVNLDRIHFEAEDKKAPSEAKWVRVKPPATGYPGKLNKGEEMKFSLVFPPHVSLGKYAAVLTYYTKEKPSVPVIFHSATVQVGMVSKWTAVSIALAFVLVLAGLTFGLGYLGGQDFNFFQSPDGGYSVSKLQVWIWTLVIVFSFSYCFLWSDAKVQLPPSTWGLLGISVASIGISKTIAAKQDEKKGGDVSPTAAVGAAGSKAAGNWLISMLSDGKQLSLMRIQMLAWTIVSAALYVIYLNKEQQLWEVPNGLLVLMGISHTGYLVDKGAAPATDMSLESIQPDSVKAAAGTTKSPEVDVVILGQNFKSDVKCMIGGVNLPITKAEANRLEGKLPANTLDAGKKYDVVLQQPGEDSEVKTDAFEVTA